MEEERKITEKNIVAYSEARIREGKYNENMRGGQQSSGD